MCMHRAVIWLFHRTYEVTATSTCSRCTLYRCLLCLVDALLGSLPLAAFAFACGGCQGLHMACTCIL